MNFSLESICNVECDEFFVMNFIIFILSKFWAKVIATNHWIYNIR